MSGVVEVEDPYLWLEDLKSSKVKSWVKSENRRLREFLGEIPSRLEKRILKYYRLPYPIGLSATKNGCYILFREGDSFKIKLLTKDEIVEILDSKSLGRYIVLRWFWTDHEGERLAVSYSKMGSDEGWVRILDVPTGEVVDELQGVIGGIVWVDKERYYYLKFYRTEKTPDNTPPPAERVFLREDSRDEIVFGEGLPTGYFITLYPSKTSSKILLNISYGWAWSDSYAGELSEPQSWRKIYGDGKTVTYPIEYYRGRYLILSYDDPKSLGRILKVSEDGSKIEKVISAKKYPIRGAVLCDGKLLVHVLENASSTLKVYGLDGSLYKKFKPKPKGSIATLDSIGDYAVFKYESFTIPCRIYKYTSKGFYKLLELEAARGFKVEDLWFRSRDGTLIHAFKVSGDRVGKVAIAYGYGGFSIDLKPTYIPHILPFLEDGGVFVMANLRGGGEYGEKWHRMGMRDKKQNVFDDFIAVIEGLKNRGFKVAALGSSNGGLLVGAVLTQKPEIIDAAVIGYPVLDMLRFHKLYIGKAWVAEYGDPEDPEDRAYLIRYSPYHNVEKRKYPKTLVFTGLHDDRVHPGHAFKFVAKLEDVGAPVYLRVETKSGHSGAIPKTKIREYADVLAFIYNVLGVKPPTS